MNKAFKKIRIVLNPIAGQGLWRQYLGKLRRGLKKKGFQLEVIKTEGPGDATRAVEDLDDQYAVLTMGGDGTINEVINGLQNKNIPLAIFPVGTGNVLCKEFRIPSDPEAFIETFSYGVIREIDLGVASCGRQFHSFLGAGMDGHIVREISKCRTGNMKQWHYILPLIKAIRSYQPTKISIKVDGKLVTSEATTVLVGNVKSYGGPLEVTSHAVSNDGLLDICFVTGVGLKNWARYLWGMLWKKMDIYEDVHYYRGKEIELTSEKETPLQIDGDFAGTLPVAIKVVPQKRALLVPA